MYNKNSEPLLVNNMLRSKLLCQKAFNLILFSILNPKFNTIKFRVPGYGFSTSSLQSPPKGSATTRSGLGHNHARVRLARTTSPLLNTPPMVQQQLSEGPATTLQGSSNNPCTRRKGNSTCHCARLVHLIITMMKWIRTSRLSIKNYPSLHATRGTEAAGSMC